MAAVRPANAPEWLFPDVPREEADGGLTGVAWCAIALSPRWLHACIQCR